MLTEIEILNITETIDKAEISFSHLRDELIDHVCCEIEYQMEYGANFQQAFENIKTKIGIRELHKVQENTLLLIDKHYRIMKTTMKIFGVIAPILIAFGALFKIQHWPVAGIILTLGFFLLIFLFLPSAVYVSYREVSNRTKLFTHISGFFAGFLYALGFLFKVQHWPGANIVILIAAAITGICFIPSFFIHHIKKANSTIPKVALSIGFFGSLVYLAGFLTKINHWPGASLLLTVGTILLIIIAFPVFVINHFKDYKTVSNKFIFLTLAIVWFVVPTMLIVLNVSQDSLSIFKDAQTNTEYHLRYLSAKNDKLYESLIKHNNSDTLTSLSEIRKRSASLIQYVQGVKDRIIIQTDGVEDELLPLSDDKIINLNNSGYRDKIKSVLFTEGEAHKIKVKMEEYRQFINQVLTDSNISQLVSKIIDTSAPEGMTEYVSSWEEINFGVSYILPINRLSGIQEDVLTVEYLTLKSVGRPYLESFMANTL